MVVSLTLEKGKSLGIVGESGCGKSVTAGAIIKLLPSNAIVESGEILFKNENILNFSDNEINSVRGKKIAFIPQDPLTSLNPLYTIGDQIAEVIAFHQKISSKNAKFLAIQALKSVNVPEAENRFNDYPHQFSGGMRQRVIIAMALCCNPELIIADEPTTALDVTVQAQILNLIKSIQEHYGTSLMLITHDLGVVAQTCDFAAVMYSGKIVEYGDIKSVFQKPSHPYTRALMEAIPSTKGTKLKSIDGQPPEIGEDIRGCKFHPRCNFRMDICQEIVPDNTYISNTHKACCYLLNN